MNTKTKLLTLSLIACFTVWLASGALSVDAKDLSPQERPSKAIMAKMVQSASGSIIDTLAPHKAIYKLKMISKKSGAAVINVDGNMYFEWRPVCDAWITDHRFNITYEYADTPSITIASDFSTYELMDGSSFDFNSSRKRGDKVIEEIRGSAKFDEPDKAGVASYTIPEGLSFGLTEDTLFPMAHTIEVIKKANNGVKFFNNIIFDGSDENGPVEINSFISGTTNALAQINGSDNMDISLINTPAHKVRMAFFPLSNSSEEADYEIDMTLHNNGIMSHMVIEYSDFTVEQNLIAIEKSEATRCENETDDNNAQNNNKGMKK